MNIEIYRTLAALKRHKEVPKRPPRQLEEAQKGPPKDVVCPGYRYRFVPVGAGRTGSPKAPSSLTNPLTKYSYEARKKQPLVQCKLDATRGIHVSRNEALQRQTGA